MRTYGWGTARWEPCTRPGRGPLPIRTAPSRRETRPPGSTFCRSGWATRSIRNGAAGAGGADGDARADRWYVDREAGSYGGLAKINGAGARDATLDVPKEAAGKTIHVVLGVADKGTPPLTRYRRVVVMAETTRGAVDPKG